MANTVKMTADNKISVIDIPWNLQGMYQAIDCDCIETVHTDIMQHFLGDGVQMIVDESGLLKDRTFNPVASALYGYQEHGCPIIGDVFFAEMGHEDFFPPQDANALKDTLMELFSILEEE